MNKAEIMRAEGKTLVSRERLENAARELWALDADCGRLPMHVYDVPEGEETAQERAYRHLTGGRSIKRVTSSPSYEQVRLVYLRRALTVLRHAGVEVDVPEELRERKHLGGCAPGYCRAGGRCEEGVCDAVC